GAHVESDCADRQSVVVTTPGCGFLLSPGSEGAIREREAAAAGEWAGRGISLAGHRGFSRTRLWRACRGTRRCLSVGTAGKNLCVGIAGPSRRALGGGFPFALRADRSHFLSAALRERRFSALADPVADRPCSNRVGHAQARHRNDRFRYT